MRPPTPPYYAISYDVVADIALFSGTGKNKLKLRDRAAVCVAGLFH